MLNRIILLLCLAALLGAQSPRGWQKGKGYGWVYGPDDEVGSLNAVTSPQQVLQA
ncbi:MAG: hypothetical protein GY953_11385, partial [bacterium]|nr:hypothetical protein [bacterium]